MTTCLEITVTEPESTEAVEFLKYLKIYSVFDVEVVGPKTAYLDSQDMYYEIGELLKVADEFECPVIIETV